MKSFILFISLSLTSALSAQENLIRPLHTFSIVARDSVTGEMGVAVQSHWFSVGPSVVWGEATAILDPGVPALRSLDERRLGMALKSGNFGSRDFFRKALERC